MKILIFGVGSFYSKRKQILYENLKDDEIVAFIDNKIKTIGEFDGLKIYNPSLINKIQFDIIIIMSSYVKTMKEQLLNFGIDSKKIKFFEQYISEKTHGEIHLYKSKQVSNGKRILIISHVIEYSGAPMTAVYAAKVLKEKGYEVWIATPEAEKNFVEEIKAMNINLAICPAIRYIGEEELFFIKKFDIVMINTFTMIQVACVISEIKPVFWWIHEADNIYRKYIEQYYDFNDINKMKKINIVAVSEIAKKNFDFHFPHLIKDTMSYGIPDRYENLNQHNYAHKKNHLVFALIGGVTVRKAQDVFLNAIKLLSINDRKNLEFWIIGSIGNNDYANKIRDMAAEIEQVKIWGTLNRNELEKIYPDIDVVVCPSLEDPLPIVMTEGMMYKKVCIASDSTGTSQYIKNGINGFVCKTNDIEDLMQKMKWCMDDDNKLKLIDIGKNARKTYEEFFTMEKFGERLEKIILQTEKNYEKFN